MSCHHVAIYSDQSKIVEQLQKRVASSGNLHVLLAKCELTCKQHVFWSDQIIVNTRTSVDWIPARVRLKILILGSLDAGNSYFYIEKWTFKIMCEVCYRAKRDKKEAT